MWLENCDVDLDYHLHRVQVPAPGGRRELDEVIGEVASTPLDRSRPLWEFHFAEGLAGGRFALIGKIHHALADGVASVNLLARAMDPQGRADRRAGQRRGRRAPDDRGLLRAAGRDHIRQIAELPGLVSDAARGFSRVRRRTRERGDHPDLADAFDAPPTFLNHVVSPQRRFATAALSTGRRQGDRESPGHHAQRPRCWRRRPADCGSCCCATTAMPTARSSRRCRPPPTSRTASPATRSAACRSRCRCTSPTRPNGPQLVALATKIAKEDHEILGPRLYGQLMGYLPTAIAPAAFRWLGQRDAPNKMMNVAVSSVRRAAGAWPLRRRPGQRDLLDGCAVTGRSGQHHRVELRRPARHRGAHRRRDLQRPA